LRASRSFPFCSKVIGVNFIDYATKAIMGKKTGEVKFVGKLGYVGVKAPQFSFSRLSGADPVTGVEMASTGEAACLGTDIYDAFLKAMLATKNSIPQKNVLVSVSGEESKYKVLKPVRKLSEMGFEIYATETTGDFLRFHGIRNRKLFKVQEKREPNVLSFMKRRKIDFIINIPSQYHSSEWDPDYLLRRTAVDYSIPLITNLELTKLFIKALTEKRMEELEVKDWGAYVNPV
jgi:methylglyoxal synthase